MRYCGIGLFRRRKALVPIMSHLRPSLEVDSGHRDPTSGKVVKGRFAGKSGRDTVATKMLTECRAYCGGGVFP